MNIRFVHQKYFEHRKVANCSTPRLVAFPMKGKFYAFFPLPFREKLIFEIVARSTVRDSTAYHKIQSQETEVDLTLYI